MCCAIDLLIGPVLFVTECKKKFMAAIKVEHVSTAWGALVTLEFSTIYFLERLKDELKNNFSQRSDIF